MTLISCVPYAASASNNISPGFDAFSNVISKDNSLPLPSLSIGDVT